MPARASRAYKLKLSGKGIRLFLDCHARLCRLACDLLPYGTTLRVAVTMLEAMPPEDLASELDCEKIAAFAGKTIRFVGTSPSLAHTTTRIASRVAAATDTGASPHIWKLFLAALSCMRAADDNFVLTTLGSLRKADELALKKCSD